jgi:hypothetical protein
MIDTDAGYGQLAEAAKPVTGASISPDVRTDRRRPGRTEVSPVLVPLLRRESVPVMTDIVREASLLESDWEPMDALRPARGIAYGLLLSLPLWAALLATCHVAIKLITQS